MHFTKEEGPMNKMYRFLSVIAIALVAIFIMQGCKSHLDGTSPGISPGAPTDIITENPSPDELSSTVEDKSLMPNTTENPSIEQEITAQEETPLQLDESKYQKGTVFYPKEYAKELGYDIFDSTDVEDHFSTNNSGTIYYIITAWNFCGLFYEKDGGTYSVCMYDRIAPDPAPIYKTATGGCMEGCTDAFLENEQNLISSLILKSAFNPVLWRPSKVGIEIKFYDSPADYSQDGFIYPWSLQDGTTIYTNDYYKDDN